MVTLFNIAVESIYDAAPDPTRWPIALQAIADCFGDVGAFMIYQREDGGFGAIGSKADNGRLQPSGPPIQNTRVCTFWPKLAFLPWGCGAGEACRCRLPGTHVWGLTVYLLKRRNAGIAVAVFIAVGLPLSCIAGGDWPDGPNQAAAL
jgi:hypothetical protein